MFNRHQAHLIWQVVQEFYYCKQAYEAAYLHFMQKLEEFARLHRTDRKLLTLTIAEIAELFDFKKLESLRDDHLFHLKENCHLLFRMPQSTDKLDRYISDIYHEISILKEEHYRSFTYAPQYANQNEMEAHHQALVELNQGVLSRTEQIMRMFSHSRERLEEMLSDFGEVKQFIRSLYLFGRERIQEIEEGGMEKFYFKVYPKRGPLEGYFQVGKSFLASGFHQEAYFALKKAKDHFPPKNFMDKETETLVTEIEALYSQALSGSDDKWGSARFKARR